MSARVRSSARSEVKRRLERKAAELKTKTLDAYDEGRNARLSRISRLANPWPAFDPKFQQWAMGWLDADRADRGT